MQLIDSRTQCKCHYGCNIYTGKLAKYIGDGKTYCVEHGRVKSLYNGFRVWIGRQMRLFDNIGIPNVALQKFFTSSGVLSPCAFAICPYHKCC